MMLKRMTLFLILVFISVGCDTFKQVEPGELPTLPMTEIVENMTATSHYWATEGITPTPNPIQLTSAVFSATRTQVAATAIANNCETVKVDYLWQNLTINFALTPTFISSSENGMNYDFFDCPDLENIPESQFDFAVTIVFPGDTLKNMNDYIAEAMPIIAEHSFSETTFGNDRLTLNVRQDSFEFRASHKMNFSLSDMQSALDDGLEGEALLDALGGLEAIAP